MTTIYLLTYIVSAIISFSLALFLITSAKRTLTLSYLSYAAMVITTWFVLESLIKFLGFNEFYSLFAWKVVLVLRYASVYFFTLFVLSFVEKKPSKIFFPIFIALGLIFSVIIIFTDKVFIQASPSIWGGYDHLLGSWGYYILPTIALSMLPSGYFLLIKLIEIKEWKIIRKQFAYILGGASFVFLSSLVDDVGFHLFGIISLNLLHIPVAIFVLFFFRIIYKLEAFEMGTVKLKIRHKLLVGLLISASIPILIVYYTNLQPYQEVLTDLVLERAGTEIESHSTEIATRFERYKSDVIFLEAASPICDCLESNGEYKEIEDTFVHLMNSSDIYMQIRYIDEVGNEKVRVDSVDSITTRILEEDLQYKGDRYYFVETMALNKGEIFVSPIDLNKEGSPPEIEIPYSSVIRYATPAFDSSNNKRGIIITNIFADVFIEKYHVHDEHIDFLIDNDGYYLSHNKQAEKGWGGPSDLNTGENIKRDFPEIADQLLSGDTGSIVSNGDVFSYFSIYPAETNKDYFLVAVELNPHESIFYFADRLRLITYMSLFFSVLIVLMIGYYIARTISQPINKLHKSIEAVRHGDLQQEIIVNSQDEIGDLARAYSDMIFAVRESRRNIEQKVLDQTRNIENQKDEIAIERDKLETTLRSIGDGVFVIDTERKISLFNNTMEEISGYTSDEVSGKICNDVLRFVKEGTDEERGDCIVKVLEKGILQTMEKDSELIRKDGSRIAVADSAAPIKDIEGNIVGAVIVIRDVTQERAIDKAKSEFVSTTSHQLRTPLVGIKWVIERFIKEEKLTESGKGYLKDIEKSMLRLIELVDALLNVSRLESAGGVSIIPSSLEAVSYIGSFLEENSPLVDKKKLTVIYDNKPEKLDIITDVSAFSNILQSIVSNAIEYTPDGGEIEISIERKDGRFIITIRDTGIGIPKDEQKIIFDKFGRASNARLVKTDGTGLGLYVAKQAVELLGGKIWFESEVDKGTTFFIELPIKSEEIKGEKKLT